MTALKNLSASNLLGALACVSIVCTAPLALAQESYTPNAGLQSVDLPTVEELQKVLSRLDGFILHLDRYISDVYRLTEDYREFVQGIKPFIASCEVEEDISKFEAAGFASLAAGDRQQCNSWVRDFDETAWQHAKLLTEAQEYQKLLQQLGENVSRQQDRILVAMRARRLNEIVEQGLRDVNASREGFAPWMDQ